MYCDCTRDGVVHHNSTNAHTLQWEFQVSSQQYLLHSTSMYSCVGFVSKTLIHTAMEFSETDLRENSVNVLICG